MSPRRANDIEDNLAPDIQDDLSYEIRRLLTERGMSQVALSRALGWDAPRLSNKLAGRRRWTVNDLAALAAALGVRPAALLRHAA